MPRRTGSRTMRMCSLLVFIMPQNGDGDSGDSTRIPIKGCRRETAFSRDHRRFGLGRNGSMIRFFESLVLSGHDRSPVNESSRIGKTSRSRFAPIGPRGAHPA
jgi:hypothetical protein